MNRYTTKGFKYESDSPMSRLQELENKVEDGEIVEVRHGHWQNENQRPKTSKFICSVCGGLAYYIQPNRDRAWIKHCPYKHCPNCGAIMDGERKER